LARKLLVALWHYVRIPGMVIGQSSRW